MKTTCAVASLLIVVLIAAGLVFSQDQGCDDPCGKPTPWDKFNKFNLKLSFPSNNGYSEWNGQFDEETKDIKIDVESVNDDKTTAEPS